MSPVVCRIKMECGGRTCVDCEVRVNAMGRVGPSRVNMRKNGWSNFGCG